MSGEQIETIYVYGEHTTRAGRICDDEANWDSDDVWEVTGTLSEIIDQAAMEIVKADPGAASAYTRKAWKAVLDRAKTMDGHDNRVFRSFCAALLEFREAGGAMHYHQASNGSPELWEVLDADDLEALYPDAVAEGKTARTMTEDALSMGGLASAEIEAELRGWTNTDNE